MFVSLPFKTTSGRKRVETTQIKIDSPIESFEGNIEVRPKTTPLKTEEAILYKCFLIGHVTEASYKP